MLGIFGGIEEHKRLLIVFQIHQRSENPVCYKSLYTGILLSQLIPRAYDFLDRLKQDAKDLV